jgi:phosphoribosylformylglycinamidine synthase
MSGSSRDPENGADLAVPPTGAVFAAGAASVGAVRSGALSGEAGSAIIVLYVRKENEWESFKANMRVLARLAEGGFVRASYPVGSGGIAAALALMAFGNMTGVEARGDALTLVDEQSYPGAVLLELSDAGETGKILEGSAWKEAGRTIKEPVFRIVKPGASPAERPLEELRNIYESVLTRVYPQKPDQSEVPVQPPAFPEYRDRAPRHAPFAVSRSAKPLAVLPVFPGTNCEWDMEQAFIRGGAETRQLIFRNRSAGDIADSIHELSRAIGEARILALSGGFSAGDEPDGSGKFIANVLRSPRVAGAINEFLEKRGGLILGICNGFQALIKLGLVPYGRFIEPGENSPTLTFNRIGRHVSRMVRTRVMSVMSPWLALEEPGTVHILPVSHGEGRLVTGGAEGRKLFETGQVPFCYVDQQGTPAAAEPDNPNGSDFAIEGLTSPDGRILGKMGHSERRGKYVHINIPGNKVQRIFEAGAAYFK